MFKQIKRLNLKLIPRHLKVKLLVVIVLCGFASLASSLGIVMLGPMARLVIKDGAANNIWEQFFTFILEGSTRDQKVFFMGGIFLTLAFLKFILLNLYSYWTANLIYSFREYYTAQAFERYIYATMDYVDKTKMGTLLSNIFNQPALASDCVNIGVQFLRVIVNLSVAVILLFLTDYKISLLVFSFVGVLFLLISKAKSIFREIGKGIVKVAQDISAVGTEALSSFRYVKLYQLEDKKIESFNNIAKKQKEIYQKNYFYQLLPSNSYELVFALSGVAFLLVYHYWVGSITAIIPSLIVLAGLVMKVFSDVFSLSEKLYNVYMLIPALEITLDQAEEKVDREDTKKGEVFSFLNKDIQVKNLSYAYPNGDYVFKNLNMAIPHGKITAIIGESGCGKSTLMDLLTGVRTTYQGNIFVNGVELKNLNLTSFRKKIGFVPQRSYLFDDSIWGNITISDEKDEARLYEASQLAHAHQFVQGLEKGYDTEIQNSTGLSGGQMQRICIARALYREPEIFIFDEATSALDEKTSKIIDENLKTTLKGKTVILITHRETTLKYADNIINLSELK